MKKVVNIVRNIFFNFNSRVSYFLCKILENYFFFCREPTDNNKKSILKFIDIFEWYYKVVSRYDVLFKVKYNIFYTHLIYENLQ